MTKKYTEEEIQSNELKRIENEENRIENEENRIENEAERVANEIERIAKEENRIGNEAERVANEIVRNEFYDGFNDRLDVVNSQLAHNVINIDFLNKRVFVSVTDFGAKGDGVTDDIDAINNAIEYAYENSIPFVLFPSGHYRVRGDFDGVDWNDIDYGIKLRSNIKCILSDDAIIQTIPTKEFFYKVFNIHECENVEICGGTIIGDRIEGSRVDLSGDNSEYGHGISISRSKNIVIRNLTTRDNYGDGIIINTRWDDADKVSENILIENVICDNNRRQGLSILTSKNVTIRNCKFINTNGTAPQCGIDIEPDGVEGVVTENITIDNCYFNNNESYPIWLAGEENFEKCNLYITNCVFDNTTGTTNSSIVVNKGYKNVFITNNTFKGYGYAHIVPNSFDNINILNNVFDSYANRAIWVDNRSEDGVIRLGKVNIEGNYFLNNRTAIYLTVSSNDTTFNISNNVFRGYTEDSECKVIVSLNSQWKNSFNIKGNTFYSTLGILCASYGTDIQNNRFIECPKQCIILNSNNRYNVISNNYFEDTLTSTEKPIIEILYGNCHYNVIQNNVFNSSGCTYTVYDDLGTVNAIINNVTMNNKQISVTSSDKNEGNINLQS